MHPVRLLIASSVWITSVLSVPLPQDESWITDLLGQRRVQQHQHLDERDLHLGLAGGFAISTFISAVRNRRFRSETERRIRDMKRKYVELRNRMPLDQTEIRETYWDEMDEFFADEKLVECMKYNLGVEDDWDPPLYISPDRWNAVGPTCPGWKNSYRASPGSFRNIIPPKRVNGEQTKGSTEEGRPHQFSLESISARMMDAVNRMPSLGTKAVTVKKGPSWMPKVQGASSIAPVPVL